MEKATFAAGCFWGVEETFRQVDGVVSTTVGYTGGDYENPTYKEVCSKKTGHAEAVRVEYDPQQLSYDDLLEVFWNCHDPKSPNPQRIDPDGQYRSAIFYHDQEQKKAAEVSKKRLQNQIENNDLEVVTEISPASEFYQAEEYHQKYIEKRSSKVS